MAEPCNTVAGYQGESRASLFPERSRGSDSARVRGWRANHDHHRHQPGEQYEAALPIAREYPNRLFTTAGVHPHDSRNCTDQTILALRRLAANRDVVAIGECGLDFNRDFSPRPQQEKWFEAQIALAEELQMPIFLHERDAHQRFCEILTRARKKVPAVIHCFTGTREVMKCYLDLGLHIGITGWICDERRGMHLREFVKEIPPDRLMIETDAPFLLPRTMSSKPKDGRNEPAFLSFVLNALADCLGKPVELAAQETTKTAREFFRISQNDPSQLQ